MGGRHFAQYNKATPEVVVRLLPARPACFTDPRDWLNYLMDVHRGTLNDPPNRQRLIRGELPDYCSDCSAQYQARMQAQGKCCPPPSSNSAGGCDVSLEPAAREAGRTRTAVSAPSAEVDTDTAGLLTEPNGNARIGFSVPASVFALAGFTGGL